MPTYSIARPSRLVRESATTMRYCGLRILPIRRSRILTATVFFAPDDFMGEPTEPTWGCGTDVSWTGDAVRVRGRLARAGYQGTILPDHRCLLPIGPRSRSKSRCRSWLHGADRRSRRGGAGAQLTPARALHSA